MMGPLFKYIIIIIKIKVLGYIIHSFIKPKWFTGKNSLEYFSSLTKRKGD